jgi:membrane protein DedA with SNARE-associated domain
MHNHVSVLLANVADTITAPIDHHGAVAIFLLMALDAVFPAAGEIVMLYSGAMAAGAIAGANADVLGMTPSSGVEMYIVLALCGTLGYLLGSLVGWGIGRFGGRALVFRYGRLVHLPSGRVAQGEAWFDRRGASAIFLARLTPLVRSGVSIVAGVLSAPLLPYTVLTLAASAVWCFGFAGAGWALGASWETADEAFRYVEVALAILVIGAGVVVLRRRRSRHGDG